MVYMPISYEDFLDKCKDIYSSWEGKGTLEEYHYSKNWSTRNNKIEKPRLIVEWSTGGMSGGSCWGGEPEPYTNNDPIPELELLDKILETFYPQLSFLQYRALTSQLLKSEGYSVGEYYGNSHDYQYKEVDLRELYDYMVEKNFLVNE